MYKIGAIILLLAISNRSVAQEKNSPILKGVIEVSIQDGTIDCEFSIEEMPIIKNSLLLINTGFNIEYIRNIEDEHSFYYERVHADSIAYESFGYYIPNKTGRRVNRSLRFKYTGKFPVVRDTTRPASMDWKGNIAFNGYSLRMDGLQSGWYPVLYDIDNDKSYNKVRCDIEVVCKDCNAIYLNGQAPVLGTAAHFKNNNPLELLLYAGNYKVKNIGNTYFLNTGMADKLLKEFGNITDQYKRYYEDQTLIHYRDDITYIQTSPVSIDNAWLFVSYPTIVNVGRGENEMKESFTGESSKWARSFIAHELAHYYFGFYKSTNSPVGDVICEGFAEYLALTAVRKFDGDDIYKAALGSKLNRVEKFKPIPFAQIGSEQDYKSRELYVYNYAPIILCAIEKEIGRDAMWKWIRLILNSKEDMTNYTFMKHTLTQAVFDKEKLQKVITLYMESDMSLDNAREVLQ